MDRDSIYYKQVELLDRQHPRDIYDMMQLMCGQGITRDIFEGFLVYLISHSRPISELLDPNIQDMEQAFENPFEGMTKDSVDIRDLKQAQEDLNLTVRESLTEDDKQFLVSVKNRAPDWSLLKLEGIEQLPAVQWKLKNLGKMSPRRHEKALKKLQKTLGLI